MGNGQRVVDTHRRLKRCSENESLLVADLYVDDVDDDVDDFDDDVDDSRFLCSRNCCLT